MTNATPGQEAPAIDIHDVLFALIRHKWKIVIFTLLGFAAATAIYLLDRPVFQSESKLLVKYVLDRSAVDTVESQSQTSGRYADTLMNAELAILSSWDLAVQVAEAFGPDRILAKEPGEHTVGRAAGVIRAGLVITVTRGSNVISVAFRHPRPSLPQPLLEEFVKRYFDKHLEVHRSTQAFDFVSQQKDLVRARLNDLDAKIKALKSEAGIFSLSDSETQIQSQMAQVRQQLMATEAELAEGNARTEFFNRGLASTDTKSAEQKPDEHPAGKLPSAVIQDYQALVDQLALSRKSEAEFLNRYTTESEQVKSARARIVQLQERRTKLEEEYPALRAVPAARSVEAGRPPTDGLSSQVQAAAAKAKYDALQAQLKELQLLAGKIDSVSGPLEDMERQRELEQKNYVDFQSKLEKARIDEALDPSKIPNISTLQKPSPPAPVAGKTVIIAAGLAGGGLVLGLATAIVFGVLLDRTVKRPGEIESRLRIPLMVSIPRMIESSRRRRGGDSAEDGALALTSQSESSTAPWQLGHFVRPFAEAIRNRVILGFELKKITHKPKLIGVTSLSGGQGVSTMAGGLAASLSETGDGKVLLVDMNADNPEMRTFLEGHAAASLVDVLQAGSHVPSAGENLYLATGKSSAEGALSIAPRKFYELMPVLRASAFDYIIFDLPPLDQSGATLAVSGFLDKMLLMVEAEKVERPALKRAHAELVTARADVSVVLNKADQKMPKWALG